jgi:hypothetical protein
MGMNAPCETCGNHYAEPFQVVIRGKTHTFDSFECAIHLLAPLCAHCGCRIIGHGEEADGKIYCCSHCLRHATGEVREHVAV